jgi:DNA-binding winged helix-turn-helix (wHTH) protein
VSGIRRFGDFRFDPATGEVSRGELLFRRLPNQPARMLALLTSRPGEVVTREDLKQALWGDQTFVDFNACLNYSARKIRIALGDDADCPTYLETVPRRGYRFIAQVSIEDRAIPVSGPTRRWKLLPLRRFALSPAALCLGLVAGLFAGLLSALVAEQTPWHQQVVDWLHLRLGFIPGVCYWPWA